MKKKFIITMILIILSSFIFFFGYNTGFKKGTIQTISEMLNMQELFIAQRAAATIYDLHQIKSQQIIKNEAICDLKKMTRKSINDWESCKNNNYCNQRTKSGYYSSINEKISDFAEIYCEK